MEIKFEVNEKTLEPLYIKLRDIISDFAYEKDFGIIMNNPKTASQFIDYVLENAKINWR